MDNYACVTVYMTKLFVEIWLLSDSEFMLKKYLHKTYNIW